MSGRTVEFSLGRLMTFRSRNLRLGLVVGVVVALMIARVPADAQVQIQARINGVPGGADGDATMPQTATVESNPDAESLLHRAGEYVSQEQYREAILLLQHVLDRYGDSLAPDSFGVYLPARRTVERVIASLGTEGLSVYRLTADPEARALTGGDPSASRDAEALDQVVQRYFISSVGDDAAYTLACLLAERGEHVRAAFLLRRILDEYPDPTVDRTAVKARLAIALADAGATTAAKRRLDQLAQDPNLSPAAQRLVVAAIEAGPRQGGEPASDDWLMAWGAADRAATMPSLKIAPATGGEGVLALLWSRQHPLRAGIRTWGGMSNHYSRRPRQSRPGLIQRWDANRWLPTAQTVFRDGLVFYKTYDEVICRDVDTGREVWRHTHQSARNANVHSHGYHSSSSSSMPATPTSIEEVLLFGDHIGRSVSLIGDRIYHIGDHQLAGLPNEYQRRAADRGNNFVVGNQLVALDAKTGEGVWRRGRRVEEKGGDFEEARFLAVPVPGDQGVITVVERNGELYLACFNDRGNVVWERFLCARPAASAPRWHATALTVHDDRVYVLPGEGLVFAASSRDGSIAWAAPYERSAPQQANYWRTNSGFGRSDGVKGWPENALFVDRGIVAAAPWDAEKIILLDPQTGRPATDPGGNPIGPINVASPEHIVGTIDGRIVSAERGQLVARELTTGKIKWKAPPGRSKITGRAAITADAIYVPSGDHVLQVDPRGGRLQASPIRCVTPFGDPVGNLYCDGQRLLATGADHLYALVDGQAYLASLTERIDKRDSANARLARAQLGRQLGKADMAVDDFRVALALADDDRTRELARRSLIDALLTGVEGAETADAAARLAEAERLAVDTPDQPRVRFALAQHRAAEQPAESLAIYLGVVESTEAEEGEAALIELTDDVGTWRVGPRALASERIDALIASADPTLSAVIDEHAAAALAGTEPQSPPPTWPMERFSALNRVALSYPRTAGGREAIERMARFEQFDHKVTFELAQAALGRLAHQPDVVSAAAAQRALAGLYEWKGFDQEAVDAWARYADRFGDLPVGTAEAPMNGAEFAGRQIERIDAPPIAATDMPTPPWKKLWEVRGSGTYPMRLHESGGSQFLRDHVFLMMQGKRALRCYDAGQSDLSKPVWQIPVPAFVADQIQLYNNELMFNGVVGGDMIVFRDKDKLLAYGLVSGKRLWSVDAEPLDGQDRRAMYYAQQRARLGYRMMAIDDAVMLEHVITPQFIDEVIARDAVTGRVLWRRAFAEHAVEGIHLGGGRAVIVADGGNTFVVCDRYTGRAHNRIELTGRAPNQAVVFADHHVLMQSGANAECLDLTTGKVVWRRPCQGQGRFGLVGGDRAFVVDHQRAVHIVSLEADPKVISLDAKAVDMSTDSVALSADGGEVFCVGYDNQRNRALAVFNVETGKRAVGITFGRNYVLPITADTYARCGEYLPWVDRVKNERGHYTGQVQVVFYRKSDGERFTDHALPSRMKDSKFQYLSRPPEVYKGVLIVASHSDVQAFGTMPADEIKTRPNVAPKPAEPVSRTPDTGALLKGLRAAGIHKAGSFSVSTRNAAATITTGDALSQEMQAAMTQAAKQAGFDDVTFNTKPKREQPKADEAEEGAGE